VLHPLAALGRAVEAPSLAWSDLSLILTGIRHLAGMGAPPRGPFDVEVGPARRFATAEAPFSRIRDVKNALGGTVNDVVLAAVAGGLQALLAARGEPTRGRVLRVMVPVSVRSRDEATDVGNRVAPVFVDVPVGKMASTTRLRRITKATRALKESGVAVSADSLIGLGAYAPPSLHATAARLVSRGRWFNLVVSNVPASQVPLFLAGAPLLRSYPAMPLGENCALSIACTSVGGTMAFGLTADWDAVKDLDVLARGIERAIDDLAEAAGLG
jgi:WS/DGAT/MGAT family acyltransferase